MKAAEKINKSLLFKRAWYLVKTKYYSLSYALKMVWADFKQSSKIKEDAKLYSEFILIPMSAFNPRPETMAEYYNSSSYKGD